MNQTKLWTKDFIIVSLINFLLTLVFYLLVVTIAAFAIGEYGATVSQSGLVSGIFIIGALIGRFVCGSIIEIIGRKRLLIMGAVLFILMTALYFVHLSIGLLIVLRLLHGITHGMASTAAGTVVAQIIPGPRKAEGISYYSMSTTLATALGPFIGLFMLHHTTFPVIFMLCLILAVISFIISIILKVPAVINDTPVQQKEEKPGISIKSFIEPKAVPIGIIILLLGFGYSSVLTYINFYATEINLVTAASFFFLVYSIIALVSRPFSGPLMDKKGANLIMYPAFILYAISMFMLSTASSSWVLLLAGAIMGLGYGNMQSATQAIAIKEATPARMGLATSTYFIFYDAGLGLSPYILGYITPYTGYGNMYAIMAAVILVTGVLYFFLHGLRETKRQRLAH
ncbi:MFS transporter [Oceanobacillus sp. 143]|uniref:MFS transporter n=1 Tax=Oceanobacillus zhaokaii TaxID=2052660 RepID=A0A345PLR4_9BACI|nr:MFS transporter [Oceanobacillus zhaokaii]AXI10944.1 MFS transporter [Oceanobacillus zhaokaii]QGS69779.1 MFS transporter [Oceanobacillus sp. 143]